MSLETADIETPDVERESANAYPTMPGLESLGWGYEVFEGDYASTRSTTLPLFDLTDMVEQQVKSHTYMIPRGVNFQELAEYAGKWITGKTIQEHQTKLLQQTGISGAYMGFKASLEVSFDRSTFRRSTYQYATYIDLLQRWQLRLPDYATLSSILKPNVAEDIESLLAEDLFEKYGTHYLWGIIVGARAAYSSATNTQAYKSTESLAIDAQASYEAFVSVKSKTEIEASVAEFRKNSKTRTTTKGGNPALGRQILEMGKYDEWIASTEDWPAFVDFAYRGLRPIWELCTDESRKGILKEAYKDYADMKGKRLDTGRFPLQTGDKIALQAHNGLFLGHSIGGALFIQPTVDIIKPNAEVTVQVLGEDIIALLADNGKYWGSTSFKGRTMLAANQPNTRGGDSSHKVTYFKDEGKIALQVPDRENEPYLKPSYSVKIADENYDLIEYEVIATPDRLHKFSVHFL